MIGGDSAVVAAGRVGVAPQVVQRWAKLAGMVVVQGRLGGVVVVPPVVMRGVGHGRRLSFADRVRIEDGKRAGWSIRKIAGTIGAAPSTVTRELDRASLTGRSGSYYDAAVAQQLAGQRRARPRPAKLDVCPELRAAVVDGLNDRFSPQQIAGMLARRFGDREEMRVSHETIYQALYVQGRGVLRHELTVVKALRSGRGGRIPRSKLPRRSNRPWLDGSRLVDRPPEAADRAVPGHWEGDLVVGPENSGLVTLVERRSRATLLGRLPGARDSATVNDVMTGMIEQLPKHLFKTITWDQGTEMAAHAEFTVKTGCPVFFCDPHSPWQRPTNENTNGLVRDFYPKGTNFNTITDAEIAQTQRLLNIRPRAVLEYATPSETLNEYIQNVALTD